MNGHKEKNESDIPAFHNPKAAFKRNYTLAGFDDLLKEHRGLMGISHTKELLNIGLPNVGGLLSIKDLVTSFDTELKKIKTPGKQKFIFENLNFDSNFKALKVARVYDKLLSCISTEEKLDLNFIVKNVFEANGIPPEKDKELQVLSSGYRLLKKESRAKNNELNITPKNILTNNLVLDYAKGFLGAVFGVFHQIAANGRKQKQIKLGKEYHWKNEPKLEPLDEPITPTTMVTHGAKVVGAELKNGAKNIENFWKKYTKTKGKAPENQDRSGPNM